MKMIDVLTKQANKEIEDGTILKIADEKIFRKKSVFEFKFNKDNFYHEVGLTIEDLYSFDTNFLNSEVIFIEPIPKEYQLRLYKEDDLSYVVRSSYNSDFNYDLGSKIELCEFTTKFTQEEIDNDKFLKFIEQHGIKEEVED